MVDSLALSRFAGPASIRKGDAFMSGDGPGVNLTYLNGPDVERLALSDEEILARLLYFGLRNLDERGAKVIVCPVPEMGGLGEALRDRLEKAARVK